MFENKLKDSVYRSKECFAFAMNMHDPLPKKQKQKQKHLDRQRREPQYTAHHLCDLIQVIKPSWVYFFSNKTASSLGLYNSEIAHL